jgi:RHS repeat-associated protein
MDMKSETARHRRGWKLSRAGTRRYTAVVTALALLAGLLVPFTLSSGVARAELIGTTSLVATAPDGYPNNGNTTTGTISSDGRYIIFSSEATNLVAGDTNGQSDVFVRDRSTNVISLVSVASDGTQGNGSSFGLHAISADGRYVTFSSSATNLVPGDTNGQSDVFLRDRQTGTTTRISVSSTGTQSNGSADNSSMSADGRFLYFTSGASNLVGGDTNGQTDVFVRDRQTGTTTRVSVSSTGTQGNGFSWAPSVSANGRYVSFASQASNLVAGDTNGLSDLFLRDTVTGVVTREAVAAGSYSDLSADGRFIAFESSAGLVPEDTNGARDVYRRDRQTGLTKRVSVSSSGAQGDCPDGCGYGFPGAWTASISANGRYVSFQSGYSNLVAGDTDGVEDIFLHDSWTRTTTLASVYPPGTTGRGDASVSAEHLSGDGHHVVFGYHYLFVRDLVPVIAPVPSAQTRGNGRHGKRSTTRRADPVDTATGAFVETVTDLEVSAPGVPFSFARTYNSNDPATTALGTGWSSSLGASLVVAGGGDATVRTEDGAEIVFTADGSGGFVRPPAVTSTLATVAGGYELTRADQVRYRFDTTGRLLSVKDRSGQGVTLAYDALARLSTATDAAGRVFTLAYDEAGKLASLSAPAADGRSVSYGYTGDLLTSVTDVRGGVTAYRYDAGGRLDQVTDPDGDFQVRNTYDAAGRVTQQLDPLGNPTTFAWDSATQTSTVTDPKGKTWADVYDDNVLTSSTEPNGTSSVTWDDDLNPLTGTDANGSTWEATYDDSGNILTRTAPAPLAYTESWTYDAANNPLTYTDGRGNTTTYAYDSSGRLTTTTYPGGATEARTYNAAGQVATLTDARDKTTTYSYDTVGNLASVTTPMGNKTTWTHDAAGRPLTRVAPRGNVTGGNPAQHTTTWTYDAAGNVLTETDALGRTTTSTYDSNGRVLTRTDDLDRVTTYTYNDAGELLTETAPGNLTTTNEYDSRGQPVAVTTPTGARTTYAYDDAGRMASMVEPRGNVTGANPADYRWTYGYDANGNQTTVTDPLGHTTTQAYDALNRLASVTDANNHTTTHGYDANSNRTSLTNHLNQTTTWAYDARNRATSTTNPLGRTWTKAYDANGNLTSETTPLGAVTSRTYDDDNRLTAVVDPLGNATGGVPADHDTLYGYDADGNRTSETDPLGRVTSFAYDRVGNRTGRTDALNHTTTWGFDALNRLASVSAPASGTTAYGYDTAGDLTSRTDAKTHTTTYGYDADHRLTSLTSPTGRLWTYGYDAAGNRTTTVDAKANAAGNPAVGTTTATYDRAGRLVGIDYSDATPDVTLAYDDAGNRTSMTDGSGTETRSYDGADRLTAVTRAGDSFAYGYDAAGQLTSRTYPGGSAATLGYDNDGRLTSVAAAEGTTTYTYDVAARPASTTLPNGILETRTHDNAGRVASVFDKKGNTTVASFSYTRDAVGNPTQVVATSGTQTYTYDAADRLASVCYAASCTPGSTSKTAWTYDDVGNRLTETTGTATRSYSYNAADQLTSSSLVGVTTNYGYDANGNQTSAGLDTFGYDMAGRTTSAVKASPAATHTYLYDGDGKRLRTTTVDSSGTAVTNAAWDLTQPVPEVAVERNAAGSVTRRYSFGLDRIATTAGSSTSFYNHDALGSVANMTSTNGAKDWTYTYEPFGTVKTTTKNRSQAVPQPVRFTGEQLDGSGLYHLRARQYDPITGRFTAVDPLAPDIADPYVSSYVYANDRPTVLVDPTGEKGRKVGASVKPSSALTTIASAPGYGVVRANLFVMAKTSGYPGIGRYSGDGRGFNPTAGPADSRASIRVDFNSGSVNSIVNSSCKVGGGCKSAYPVVLNPPWASFCAGPTTPTVAGCRNAIADSPSSPNLLIATPFGRGVKITYSLTNAAAPKSVTPTIDGHITIETVPGSSKVRACASGDPYPSLEAYHDVDGRTIELLTLKESGFGPGALFAPAPDRYECKVG